ncbi:MAG: hypothetical protein QOE00_475, partial [Ilumatobacteraceae bacterium]
MMIPIGVEASTATAPAVDGAVPTGFRDGLLAALSAGASTPAVELAQMVKLSGSAAVAAPTSTVTSASASASVSASATSGTDPQTTAGLSTTPVVAAAADLVALDVTSQVSGATGASAATSVSGADTTPVAPAPELAAAVVKAAASGDVPDQPPVVDSGTPPVPPVWSAKGRPGRRVTLQSPVLESIEANRSPGNTPQHRRVADLGQDLAIRQSPAVANAAGQALGGQPTPAQNLAIPVTPTESATIVTAPSAAEVSMVASTAVAPQAVATATTTVKPSITKDGTTHAAGVGDVAAGNATEVDAAKDVVIGQAALLPPARQPVVR